MTAEELVADYRLWVKMFTGRDTRDKGMAQFVVNVVIPREREAILQTLSNQSEGN